MTAYHASLYRRAAASAALGLAAPFALAQDLPASHSPRPDKSAYHLFNPTPRELMREMSTDRPDTTESAYTLDAGHFQIEMSLVDFTYDQTSDATTRAWAVAPMLLKVGLLNNVDLQLGLDPYTWVEDADRPADAGETFEGFGDTVVRLKINLWGNDEGDTALAIMPFIKAPTAADGLGNDNVEGGVIIPLAISLPADFSLGLMAEFDFIRNADDDRYVVDFVHTATISHDLIGDLAGYIEYAGFANLNHDEDYRAFFNAGLTYGLTPDVQLDAGIRLGLTDAAEDFGMFVGISMRF